VKSDPRFSIAKYTGKYGGIDMRLGPKPNWDEVEHFIVESYRIIAPKRLVRQLDEPADARPRGSATPSAQKKTSKPSAQKKTSKPSAQKKTSKPSAQKKTSARRPAAKKVRRRSA
jgi:hypothetical protein